VYHLSELIAWLIFKQTLAAIDSPKIKENYCSMKIILVNYHFVYHCMNYQEIKIPDI